MPDLPAAFLIPVIADRGLHLLVSKIFPDGPLGFGHGLSPNFPGVPDLDFSIMHKDINRMFGPALDHQVMKAGPGQFRGKKSAHIGTAEQSAERRLGHDVTSGRG
jgi:hypothetical protein